jgi:DMSO/TMAO reductase YedYZ molybdopterin-dependent catalytic subunit
MADDDKVSGDRVSLAGRIKDKLIAKKERDAAEGRHLTGEYVPEHRRLPPGQRLVEKWPVLDLGITPNVPKEAFRLEVRGAVENPVSWDWAAFMAQPQVEMTSDIHCVTSWSLYDNHWNGISAKNLLSVVKPKSEARHVMFVSYDNYTTNVRMADFDDDDVIIAHSWNGKPLDKEHGGPVRIVIPKRYFWKSAKWVNRIVFLERDQRGYWEVRGYHNEADPWEEERYG